MIADKKPVYENERYNIYRDRDPYIEKSEPMNWLVINKEHGTVESTVGSLPYAIHIANSMNTMLEEMLKDSESGQMNLQLN